MVVSCYWFVVEWRASCVSMCIQHWLNTYYIPLSIYDIEGLLWDIHTGYMHIYIYIYTGVLAYTEIMGDTLMHMAWRRDHVF